MIVNTVRAKPGMYSGAVRDLLVWWLYFLCKQTDVNLAVAFVAWLAWADTLRGLNTGGAVPVPR